ARKNESRNWVGNVSRDPFYQSPDGWEDSAPGDVLRLEKPNIDDYDDIPPGLSLYRLLYVSLDPDNRLVPASAFILVPSFTFSPNTSLKTIVWAHGTAGIERQCAPSNQKDLYYDYEGPFTIALRGYAVVAPDYAGLGSNATFHWLEGPSHAADISYAVVATRQAFPRGLLTKEWIVMGHSEGGLSAWAINERELLLPTGGFIGAIAIAPALQQLHIIRYGLAHAQATGPGVQTLNYVSFALSTIARLDPSFHPSQYLSDLGLRRARLATTGCFYTAVALFSNITYGELIKDDSWLDSSAALAWENRTAIIGDKPLAAPMLVVEGLGDHSTFPATIEVVVAKHCELQRHTRLHLSRYPNMDHDEVPFAAQVEMFRWIEDRFNGVDIQPGCTNDT
ncbi:hypothetical protein M422DRAFT_116736, partial [Sphaerobolus stellatus SS14]